MATIITIHGTAATGLEEGDAWWQRGGSLEKDIRELVEAEDGSAIHHQSLIWDGLNSEACRRQAARSLLNKVSELENQGSRYCIVGHSHGGSVVATALMLGGRRVRNLSRWVTVGTPFLQPKLSSGIFSRLGLFGRTAYLSIATMMFLIIFGLAIDPKINDRPILIGFLLIIALLIYLVVRFVTGYMRPLFRKSRRRFFNNNFAGSLVSLWHPHDEAINGLRAVKNLKSNLFARNFAVPVFTFVSLFVIPIALVLLITSEAGMLKIFPYIKDLVATTSVVKDGELAGRGKEFLNNFDALMTALQYSLKGWIDDLDHAGFAVLIAAPAILFALSLVVTTLVGGAARGVSYVASAGLDNLTWRQVRSAAYGSDVGGEAIIDAAAFPAWIEAPVYKLPPELAKEITAASDRTALASLARLRTGLGQLALFEGDKNARAVVFSEYLTWEELIHCTYFVVPRFRMLVAYIVANSPGFRPTARFQSHPDFHVVAQWYEEMMPKSAAGAQQAAAA